jgi:Haspin like kinase domain
MTLRSCRDIDNESVVTANDLKCIHVLRQYTLSTVAGFGASGVAFIVGTSTTPAEQEIVVKIARLTPALRTEIKTACTIDNMIQKNNAEYWTTVFCRTYGWLICTEIPETWLAAFEEYKTIVNPKAVSPVDGNNQVACIVSEHCGTPLWIRKFTDKREALAFMFELFYALGEAFKKFRFRHNDLNLGNILVSSYLSDREYTVDGHGFQIRTNAHPKIIDFGHSVFYPIHDQEVQELGGTRVDFEGFIYRLRKLNTTLDFLDEFENPTIETFHALLRCPCFDVFRIKKLRVHMPVYCRICTRNIAIKCYEHAPSYKFCSASCSTRMGPVASIIKADY